MIDKDHNHPPESLELAPEVIKNISGFMAEHPAVLDEELARAYKVQMDRVKLVMKDLDEERDGKVRPLNSTVAAINDMYRGPYRLAKSILDEMKNRCDIFLWAEEKRRKAIAEEAERKARAAEAAAREAERLEQERLDDAAQGEAGIDVSDVMAKANDAFEDFERAKREARSISP